MITTLVEGLFFLALAVVGVRAAVRLLQPPPGTMSRQWIEQQRRRDSRRVYWKGVHR